MFPRDRRDIERNGFVIPRRHMVQSAGRVLNRIPPMSAAVLYKIRKCESVELLSENPLNVAAATHPIYKFINITFINMFSR